MQIFRPSKTANTHQALVVVHGGSWTFGTNRNWNVLAFGRIATRAGCTVFDLDYRTFSKRTEHNRMPAELQDVQTAIRYIKSKAKQYRIDPADLKAVGFSAGAHLSMLAGSISKAVHNSRTDPLAESFEYSAYSSRIRAVADFSGPSDLIALAGGLQTVVQNLTGRDRALAIKQSPIQRVTPRSAPIFIAQGKADPLISASTQVYPYARALTRAGISHEIVTYQGGHALGDTTPARQKYVINRALDFLTGRPSVQRKISLYNEAVSAADPVGPPDAQMPGPRAVPPNQLIGGRGGRFIEDVSLFTMRQLGRIRPAGRVPASRTVAASL